MNLSKYENKIVRIVTNNNLVIQGEALDYTPSDENTPEIDSICIGDLEFYANDIKSIEIIK